MAIATACLLALIHAPQGALAAPQDALASWTSHASANCYADFGATDLENPPTSAYPASPLSLEDCQAACDATYGCSAVTVLPLGDGSGSVQCFRRGNTEVPRCASDAAYTTYIRTDPWVRDEGLNCFAGNGAHDLEVPEGSSAGSVANVEECQALCDLLIGCDAVTLTLASPAIKNSSFPPRSAQPTFSCFRRRNIRRTRCKSDASFDTYTRTAPPSPFPEPSLCGGGAVVAPSADWIWTPSAGNSPSCGSPKVDPTVPRMCENDPTSVVLRLTDAPECISVEGGDCKFDMHNVTQLDADIDLLHCYGAWTAPLWFTPNIWIGDGASGEVDMVEQCPRTRLCSNFAGGQQEVCWNHDPDKFHGHVTMRKDPQGTVTVTLCGRDGTLQNSPGSSCKEAKFPATYTDLYGSQGCEGGGNDCVFHLFSDIWAGTSGDAGYAHCSSGTYDPHNTCSLSVTDIRIASAVPFEGKCAALNA